MFHHAVCKLKCSIVIVCSISLHSNRIHYFVLRFLYFIWENYEATNMTPGTISNKLKKSSKCICHHFKWKKDSWVKSCCILKDASIVNVLHWTVMTLECNRSKINSTKSRYIYWVILLKSLYLLGRLAAKKL